MLLKISNLSFSYERKPILESITWEINAGEQWAIIGKNGSGKSTLLKCITGIEKISSGSIMLSGKNMSDFSAKQRARYIAYIPQFINRNLPFTVYDYVMMSRYAYQGVMAIPAKIDRDIVRESLILTDTLEFSERRLNTLSGGEQQRVFLAGGVAQKSQILLLDEPTTFLDPYHQIGIIESLQRIIKEYNTTVISATHEMSNFNSLYSKVLAIKNGMIKYSGSIDGLFDTKLAIAEQIFDIPFEKAMISSGQYMIFPKTRSLVQ